MRILAFPLLLLVLLSPAFSQQEKAMRATRKQKTSLEPMIETMKRGMVLHSAQLDEKLIEREIRKALEVQVSYKAFKRYEVALAKLLAKELGIETVAGLEAAGRYYALEFGRGPSASERALIIPELPPFPETENEAERLKAEKERQVVVGLQMEIKRHVDTLPYPAFGIESTHKKCVFHDKMVQINLKSEIPRDLEKDQARGMSELAAAYAPLIAAEFEASSTKDFKKRLENALKHKHTSHALFGVLVNARVFARPMVYAEKSIGFDDPKAICQAQSDVIEKVCSTLGKTEMWKQLESDHASMIEDARAFRKVLKARLKGE